MEYPLDPKAELLRWGPFPAKYFNVAGDVLESFFIDTIKRYGEVWPDTLLLVKDGMVIWISEFPAMWKEGARMFKEKILDEKMREQLWREWTDGVEKLSKLEDKIVATDLSKLSDTQLAALAKDFYKMLVNYWGPTLFPEMGNYGAEKFVEEELRQESTDTAKIPDIMEAITAPEELSFYQLEEVDLFETNDIEEHQQNYFWIRNSHNGARIASKEEFEERKKAASPEHVEAIKRHVSSVQEKKEAIKTKHGISDKIMQMGRSMAESVIWQDRRKMHTYRSLHYKKLFLDEAARRAGIPASDLYNLNFAELIELITGKDMTRELERRRTAVGVLCTRNSIRVLSPEEVRTYWDLYAEEKMKGGEQSVKGVVASKGKGSVQGTVRILLDPSSTFEKGEILIAALTSPEYILPMQKAAAIVTDGGGITSHAAIVSRELGKLCVVATKLATKVFKTGDLVEVDAEKGIVRKLER